MVAVLPPVSQRRESLCGCCRTKACGIRVAGRGSFGDLLQPSA